MVCQLLILQKDRLVYGTRQAARIGVAAVDPHAGKAYHFSTLPSSSLISVLIPMNFVARVFQLLGLIEAGYGLFIGLYEGDIKRELMFGAFGAVLFLIGWMLQKRASS